MSFRDPDRAARLRPRGYYGRPVRSDRIDPFDGSLMGPCAGLLVYGVVMGFCLVDSICGNPPTPFLNPLIVLGCTLAAFFSSSVLSRKYIVDADDVGRADRNLTLHRILAGSVPVLIVPSTIAAAVYLFHGLR